MGRDCAAGIAIWSENGIHPRVGRDFPHPSRFRIGEGPFAEVKRAWRVFNEPPHLASMLKKEYIMLLLPPSAPSWPVIE